MNEELQLSLEGLGMRVIKERHIIMVRMEEGITRVFDKECIDEKAFACSAFDVNGPLAQCQRMYTEWTGCKICRGDYRE